MNFIVSCWGEGMPSCYGDGKVSKQSRQKDKESAEPPRRVAMAIGKHFPGAMTNLTLVKALGSVLRERGYPQENTLAACCVCSDEINRFIDGSLEEHVACMPPFNLGGLAGFPFTGVTGFGAYSHHVPTGGMLVVLFGPHVGVSETGVVGMVEREGMGPGGACGAAKAAYAQVCSMPAGERARGVPLVPREEDLERVLMCDFQQHMVTHHVCACHKRAAASDEPQAELVKALAERIRASLIKIVGALALECDLAMIGGVQVNTAPGSADFFQPLSFELKKAGESAFVDILPELITTAVPTSVIG